MMAGDTIDSGDSTTSGGGADTSSGGSGTDTSSGVSGSDTSSGSSASSSSSDSASGSSGDASSGGSSSSTAAAPAALVAPVTTALNQQIVQAVDKTNSIILGAAGPEANGVGYQKVAQAAAFSVQDSTDYLRNIMTIAATTQGVCLQLMIKSPPQAAEYTPIIAAAQAAVTAAQTNFGAIGTSAGEVVGEFPSS